MDVIATHASADFDALASVMAAQRLYPGAIAILTQGLARGARELARLHRDRFPWSTPAEIDPARVRRLVLVDVRRASRLRALAPILARAGEIEIHVWDHHPASADDVPADHVVIEPVGSAVTLLVEAMRARAIEIDAVEATLFALGIHSDTGSLRFATTTARDAEALAWLLGRGARVTVIDRFLSPPFSEAQRSALALALDHVEEHRIAGLRIAVASLELDASTEGLDDVASTLFELEQPHALFLVASLAARSRVHVIARARQGSIDVAAALGPLGGGGHASAAAVSISGAQGDEVRARLLASIATVPTHVARVRDVMSSPVRTIAPDHPLEQLAGELAAWGIRGVPVVKGGALVGIVSREDLDRAARDGRMHLAAGSCMAHPVRTVDEDVPVDDAIDRMTVHGVGRLPVLRDGVLVGIVSRRDVRRVLYGEGAAGPNPI